MRHRVCLDQLWTAAVETEIKRKKRRQRTRPLRVHQATLLRAFPVGPCLAKTVARSASVMSWRRRGRYWVLQCSGKWLRILSRGHRSLSFIGTCFAPDLQWRTRRRAVAELCKTGLFSDCRVCLEPGMPCYGVSLSVSLPFLPSPFRRIFSTEDPRGLRAFRFHANHATAARRITLWPRPVTPWRETLNIIGRRALLLGFFVFLLVKQVRHRRKEEAAQLR